MRYPDDPAESLFEQPQKLNESGATVDAGVQSEQLAAADTLELAAHSGLALLDVRLIADRVVRGESLPPVTTRMSMR